MIAIVEASKNHKGVHKLFRELGHAKEPWTIHYDDQPCITIAQDTGYSGRAKHIELRFLAIQDVAKR